MAGSTDGSEIEISLDAVIVAVTGDAPRLLVVEGPDGLPALPSGLLEPQDRTLELGLRRWVADQTGLEVGYVEQLYTFGDRARGIPDRAGTDKNGDTGSGGETAGTHGGETGSGLRRLSIAYLALMREEQPLGMASWRDFYDFFPWEDHRRGRPAVIDDLVMPALDRFVAAGPDRREREERVGMAFGPGRSFDGVRVLDRCELLYEAGLLQESRAGRAAGDPDPLDSSAMYLDHRRIAATALGRLRGKLTYRPVVFELLPDRFTLRRLQHVVEALAGVELHTQNFRRLVETGGLVEGTGQQAKTGGRPAELFRFRRDVLGERPAPGVGSPWVRS